MKKRKIALCIIFTFVTFGIYGIYWFAQLTNNTTALVNPAKSIPGGVAALLTLLTFGIYGIFWAHKMGKLLGGAMLLLGKTAGNRAILYPILELFAAPVAWALMQHTINTLLDEA